MHVDWCVNFSFARVLQSLSSQPLHTPTHPYAGTHAHPSSYTHTTCAHPHAQSPTHPYTHSCHTYTHPSSFTCTTCAHPYTYLQISTNINSPQLSQSLFTNIYKYPHMLQISTNIHTVIVHGLHPYELLGITIKIQSNRVDNKRI